MISSHIQTQIVISKIRCLWRCTHLVFSSTAFQTPQESQTFYLDLEHMEVILLFIVNCPRCCAMAPFSSCSQALWHWVTTSLSLYCQAAVLFSLENCRRKDGTNSSSPKSGLTGTTSHGTLLHLVPKKTPPRRCPSCPVHILKLLPKHTRIHSLALNPHSKKGK